MLERLTRDDNETGGREPLTDHQCHWTSDVGGEELVFREQRGSATRGRLSHSVWWKYEAAVVWMEGMVGTLRTDWNCNRTYWFSQELLEKCFLSFVWSLLRREN